MKIFVKTLKGTHFVIYVRPHDSVADVKKNIETTQGSDVYPAEQLMLIHRGKVLKDPTTLEENKVVENNFIVVMLSKAQHSSAPPIATQSTIIFQAPPVHYPPIAPVHYDPLAPVFTNTQAAPRHIPVVAPQDYNILLQGASAMPHAVTVTLLERQAIERLEAMGFDRGIALEVFFACNKNEERAADYLLDHMHEFEE